MRTSISGAKPIVGGLALGLAAAYTLTRTRPREQGAKPKSNVDQVAGVIERVAELRGSMPTGVSVSSTGRIFVNYPRWGDPVRFTVAEIRRGRAVAYPDDAVNRLDLEHAADTFVSVQSVVVDPRDRLWVLDTGSIELQPVVPHGPKLVGIDLATDRIFKTIRFGPQAVLPTTYLNDIRFDLRRGAEGVAYITDSSDKGPNGIIVVDLATGQSWRRLHDHPSTKAEPGFLPFVEGRPVMQRKPGEPAKPLGMGADGIAIGPGGDRLYYCPLASRRLFSVAANLLADRSASDERVAASVQDEGPKPASDGLESDEAGCIYATAYEHNAIVRRRPDGQFEPLAHDPRILWPDTLSLATDGHLYFTANQLHRQAAYNDGHDLRVKPYAIFRVRVDATPVRLK